MAGRKKIACTRKIREKRGVLSERQLPGNGRLWIETYWKTRKKALMQNLCLRLGSIYSLQSGRLAAAAYSALRGCGLKLIGGYGRNPSNFISGENWECGI